MLKEIRDVLYEAFNYVRHFISKIPLMKFISTVSLILILYVLYLISPLFIKLVKNLAENFSSVLILNLAVFAYALLAAYSVFNYLMTTFYRRWWDKNLWTIHTFYAIVFIFVLGTVFITTELGKPHFELVLREAVNGTIAGNLTCVDDSGSLLIGNEISCTTEPKLSNMLVFISFDFLNGTHPPTPGQSNLIFTAPSNLKRIGFNIRGVDDSDQNRSFVTSNDVTGNDLKFRSEEEEKERKDKFITFFLALLGIILFTVPAAMVNFKILAEE